MNRIVNVCGFAVLAFGLGVLSAHAQTQVSPEDHKAHHPAASPEQVAPAPPSPAPGPVMQQMGGMQGMQRMMAQMAERQKALDALVAKMTASTGDAKIAAMAELLTALVQQQAEMHKGMMQMHTGMMKN